MKKVLIITYYWPPSGGSGVQRWMHFAKYLEELGWTPVIYTPENPETAIIDDKLVDIVSGIEVIRKPIWEPFALYKWITGKSKGQKIQTGFLQEEGRIKFTEKIALWLRANLFIPDAKRFWIKPSVKFLNEYLRNNPVQVMVSTGPPHSTHVIAQKLKAKLGIPWLADFRDPWTNIDWFGKLPLTKRSLLKHQRLELSVLKDADTITCVSKTWSKEFELMAQKKVHTITNGFAPEDFEELKSFEATNDFVVLHAGSLNEDRNPRTLWKYLSNEIKQNEWLKSNLKIKLIGAVDVSVLASIQEYELSNYLEHHSFIPHDKALEEMNKSSVLLLLLNNAPNMQGIIPGKLYEYLATNKTILAIGPLTGDAANILNEFENTFMIDFDQEPNIEIIRKSSQLITNRNEKLQKYSRKNLTKKIDELLHGLI